MFANSYISILTVAFGLSIATGASALEVANGLSVNGLSVNGLSVDGTEKSADLRLKAIILQDERILLIE